MKENKAYILALVRVEGRKALEDKYNELYARAEMLNKVINACDFCITAGKNKDASVASCTGRLAYKEVNDNYLCCHGFYDPQTMKWQDDCKHWDNGCTVQSLHCKIWLCPAAISLTDGTYWIERVNPDLYDPFYQTSQAMKHLMLEAARWKLLHFRCDKKTAIDKAMEEWNKCLNN